MVDKKYFLIMNPTCRAGRGKKSCQGILSLLKKYKVDFDYKMTTSVGEAITWAQEAARSNYKNVVAVGGDGTIREVITGLCLDSNNSGVSLGVLHIGTSPDFNRYHDIPVKLDKAIEVLIRGKTKLIDIGKITYMDNNYRQTQAYFGSNVNIGLGPLIAGRANSRHRKYLGDFLGTFCAMLGAMVNFKGVDLEAKIDNKIINPERLLNLTIGKDPYLASGMRVFNDLSSDDGRLYIFSVKKMPYLSYLPHIPKLYAGDFLKFKGSAISYGKEIEVDSFSDVLVEFDGDAMGHLPAKIEVMHKALEVITG